MPTIVRVIAKYLTMFDQYSVIWQEVNTNKLLMQGIPYLQIWLNCVKIDLVCIHIWAGSSPGRAPHLH